MLRKIGVTRKGINKAIFGIKVVNQELLAMGQPSVFMPALFTALIMVVVYGGYFLATYVGYRNIVK